MAVMGIWVIVTLMAFKDAVFHGILCTLIPPYFFYYLFLVADSFYMRAIIAGIMVGIAQDSMFFFQEKTLSIIKTVTTWIASGG